eukprot:203922_1
MSALLSGYEEVTKQQQLLQPEITIFNIKTNVYSKLILKDNFIHAESKIAMIDNNIHIISGCKHLIYVYNQSNDNEKATLSLLQMHDTHFDTEYISGCAFLHCKLTNKFIIFGGSAHWYMTKFNKFSDAYNQAFYQYDITKNVWTTIEQYSMPIFIRFFGHILYNDRFIMTFGGVTDGFLDINNHQLIDFIKAKRNDNWMEDLAMGVGWKKDLDDIWILDLWTENSCWMKSNIKCPIEGICFAVLQDNFVHVFGGLKLKNSCKIEVEKLITSDIFDDSCRQIVQNHQLQSKIKQNKQKNIN